MGLFVLPNAWVLLETDNSHQLCGSEFVGMKPKENTGHDFFAMGGRAVTYMQCCHNRDLVSIC